MKKVVAAAFLLGLAMTAQAACGVLDDPNSEACLRAPGAPAAATASTAATEKGRGQTVCAFFDPQTQRCLTMRPDTKQYDSAVSTGVQTAMMMMQVQADGWDEARRVGIVDADKVPTIAPGGSSAGYNNCVKDGLDQVAKAQQGKATSDQIALVLKGCAR